MTTRIAFAADLHVDTYGTALDPETGRNAGLQSFLDSLEWLVEDATQQGARGLVIAGDVTERRHAPAWLAAMIRERLDAFPGALIVLRGNHDGEVGGRSIVNLLTARTLGQVGPHGKSWAFGVTGAPGVSVIGDVRLSLLPYVEPAQARAMLGDEGVGLSPIDLGRALSQRIADLARGLAAQGVAMGDGRAHVLVVHQTIAGAYMSATQQAFLGDRDVVLDPVALATAGFDLVVAGHLHRHQVVLPGRIPDQSPVLYPGSLDRVDFGEEGDPKGYILADFEADLPTTWQFRANPAPRRFVTLEHWGDLDPSELADQPGFEGAIVRLRGTAALDADAPARLLLAGALEVRVQTPPRAPAAPTLGDVDDAEALTPAQALEAYVDAADPDRAAILSTGRDILEAVR